MVPADHFSITLLCDLPLLIGVPLSLHHDVFLRAKVHQSVAFRALVVMRMHSNRMYFYFRSPPVLHLQSTVVPPSAPRTTTSSGPGSNLNSSNDGLGGSKAGELLMLAARRALNSLVFPKVLRGEFGLTKGQSLGVVWTRETVDPTSFPTQL